MKGNLQSALYGMIITLNEIKRNLFFRFFHLKRIIHYKRCTRIKSRPDDLALMAHY